MQAYDIIMLVVVAAATLFGMIKGFAWQVASLASIIVSYLVAYNFRDQLAVRIQVAPPMNTFIAMLLLYAGTSFAIWVVFRLISSSIDRVRLRDFDRQLGALFGLGKGVMYCLLITMFAMTLLGQNQQRAIVESKSGRYISTFLTAAKGVVLPKEIDSVIRPHLERVRQQLEGGAIATTPSTSGSLSTPSPWNPSTSNSWTNDIANQVSEMAGNLMNGQGATTGSQPPFGLPTSQPMNSPDSLNGAFDAARNAINQWAQPSTTSPAYPSSGQAAGQGGWPGSASAPLPTTNPFAPAPAQPNYAPSNNFNYPNNTYQQPQQYNSILPY